MLHHHAAMSTAQLQALQAAKPTNATIAATPLFAARERQQHPLPTPTLISAISPGARMPASGAKVNLEAKGLVQLLGSSMNSATILPLQAPAHNSAVMARHGRGEG